MNWNTTSSFIFNATDAPQIPIAWRSPSHAWSFAEFEAARTAVEQFAFAEANWDGYGALAISPDTKKNALAALSRLEATAPAPSVVPNSNGTISFEWETGQGIGNLEIGRTRFSFYVHSNAGGPILLDGSAGRVYGLGPIVSGRLYPTTSEPAYGKLFISADV
jgi:hypothetical protein